jgi:hypothetical protein
VSNGLAYLAEEAVVMKKKKFLAFGSRKRKKGLETSFCAAALILLPDLSKLFFSFHLLEIS